MDFVIFVNVLPVTCSNSAECLLRLRQWTDVVRETTLSLATAFEESSVYIKTLFRRAKALKALNKSFEAIGELNQIACGLFHIAWHSLSVCLPCR